MKNNIRLGLSILAFLLIAVCMNAQYAGGSGTADDPYLIETAEHLNNVRNNMNAHFRQTANIDLDIPPYNQGEGWEPIGGSGNSFGGYYDGDGYIVFDMMINRPGLNNVGLFGFCQEATILNLAVLDANVRGGRWTGVVAGDFSGTDANPGRLENCFASGLVNGIDRVGGLAGFVIRSDVINCAAATTVEGTNNAEIGAGGLIGFLSTNGTVTSSYATGSVTATNNGTHVAGLVGRCNSANIRQSYAVGRVNAQNNVGGLVGAEAGTTTTESYWNTQTTQQQDSAGGSGRNTEEMTYPYADNTFNGWDFNQTWAADEGGNINDGYPYLRDMPGLGSDLPAIASNPNPAHDSTDVSINLTQVAWEYHPSAIFAEPVGFRVYLNTTGDFDDEDDFAWIAYNEDETNYSTGEVLPDELVYGTAYFWKVVPTTDEPDNGRSRADRQRTGRDRIRGDAENVPVWTFTTEISEQPAIAENPFPADDSTEVAVDIEHLSWDYYSHPGYADPLGFRVYMNTSGEFNDDFDWVVYIEDIENYQSEDILPETLEYDTKYYWKVVPTTDDPARGDAVDVPVWTFTTRESEPFPKAATNPHPAHRATGISMGLTAVHWDYHSADTHADPVGFRVYMNTTGNFTPQTPYDWVPYEADEIHYSSKDAVPVPLDAETTYYWRVVPTTQEPSQMLNDMKDAQDVITWEFTTGTTDVEDIAEPVTATKLQANYPNPFNPETVISFSLAEPMDVEISIYDNRGRKIVTLLEDKLTAGSHQINWKGSDNKGRKTASGVYFYRMTATGQNVESYTKTRKMILLK